MKISPAILCIVIPGEIVYDIAVVSRRFQEWRSSPHEDGDVAHKGGDVAHLGWRRCRLGWRRSPPV